MFQETSYISGTKLPSSKNKKNSLLKKVSYISGKLNFSDPSLKNFLYFSWNEENPRSSHRSFWSLDKKTSRTFHGYNFHFKWHNCIKNRGFWKILEQIKELDANRDGHSYTRVAFREFFRDIQRDDSVQNLYRIIFRILQRSTENYFYGQRLKDYIHKNIQRITFRD